jgi:phage terminase large subunit
MSSFRYTTALHRIRLMQSRKRVVQGGTSAGKTIAILMILIDYAIRNPNKIISVVAMTMPHLKRGAMRDFLKIMRDTGRYQDANWNKSESTYHFTNGSFIEFFSVEDEMKVRGPRRDVLYLNEANKTPFDAYHNMAIRTNEDIYIDYNPTNRFWVHDEVLSEPDAELLILTYRDNEGLPESILSDLESNRSKAATSTYWQNWCRVYLDGEVGQLEGAIFQNWSLIDVWPEDAKLVGYGTDWGFAQDPTTLVEIRKWEGKLLIRELIYQKGLMASDYARRVKELGITDSIIADSAEPRTISECNAYGIKVIPVRKPKLLESIHLIQEYEMLIHRDSHHLIEELTQWSWHDEKTNTPQAGFDHCIDPVRYVGWMKLGKYENQTKRPFRSVKVY